MSNVSFMSNQMSVDHVRSCEISVHLERSLKILKDLSRSCEISIDLANLSRSCEISVDVKCQMSCHGMSKVKVQISNVKCILSNQEAL